MDSTTIPGFQAMTSIRSDMLLKSSSLNPKSCTIDQPSQFYMLPYHHERMLATATEFGWWQAVKSMTSDSNALRLQTTLEQHLKEIYGRADYPCPLKLRVLLDHEGNLNVTSAPIPPVPLPRLFPLNLSECLLVENSPAWHISVSPQRVVPSPYTTHKTTNRAVYDSARAALSYPAEEGSIPSEVLLVNTDNMVMEGSITTPYFYRGETWFTPPAAHGGNIGTTRRWALEKRLCVEEAVPVSSLEHGECIWLSNGARGWGWGRLEMLDSPGVPKPV